MENTQTKRHMFAMYKTIHMHVCMCAKTCQGVSAEDGRDDDSEMFIQSNPVFVVLAALFLVGKMCSTLLGSTL